MYFENVYNLMLKSFPLCEIRSFSGQQELTDKPNYKLVEITKNDALLGFVAYWELKLPPNIVGGGREFIFVEHIAVDESLRGRGIGSKLMSFVIGDKKLIVLEVEPPINEICKKRIEFYKRLGFKMLKTDYYQPPHREEDEYTKLAILTHPEKVDDVVFAEIKKVIYTEVYPHAKLN